VPRIALLLVLLLALVLLYLGAWPTPIDPVAWSPAAPPSLAEDSRLVRATRQALGRGVEDIAVDSEGRIYGGDENGRVWRALPGGEPELFATTGGRPLGLEFAADGALIVCDAERGLLAIDPRGEVRVLTSEHGGRPYGLTDDLDIGPDGTIYFSDASDRFGLDEVLEDTFESRPNGRLLAYDPTLPETRLLLDALHFANGVAVSPDGDFVLVVESSRYRVRRYWLEGPAEGTSDVFADNLPGFPDGISRGAAGRYWTALYAPRDAGFDRLLARPFLRDVVYRLPDALRPATTHRAMVLELDSAGQTVDLLMDSEESAFAPITSVVEHRGSLLLGSISENGYARFPLPLAEGPGAGGAALR